MSEADLTQLLKDATGGNERAADRLIPLVYESLKQRAQAYLRQERPGEAVEPTALVHEAYERLVDQSRIDWQGRTHFLAMAATTMRRILVDRARKRGALKRGGGQERISLSELKGLDPGEPIDVLAVHDALERLEAFNDRHARIIEMRFFAGMTLEEIEAVLGVTSRTLKRDWRIARAWLLAELSGGE